MRRSFRVVALPLLAAAMSLTSAMFCQAADLLDRIKEKKEIAIASEARYAPFEYVEEGKIVGYDVDIFDKMMTALPGVKVTRLDLPFQGLLPGLQTSKFDAIITAITVTAQRFDSYKLSLPIADATFAVVKRKGDDSIKSPDDLAGKVIGTQAGSAQLQGAKRFSDSLQAKRSEADQRFPNLRRFQRGLFRPRGWADGCRRQLAAQSPLSAEAEGRRL